MINFDEINRLYFEAENITPVNETKKTFADFFAETKDCKEKKQISMKTEALQSRVIKTENIHWKDLFFIQDENFKEWIDGSDERLVKSLLKYQFADPFKVWQKGEKIYCLDGKHRYLDLKKIEKSGVEVPEMLPATFMKCKDKKEAAELVLIYSSQYAEITNQGLFDFVSKFEIDLPKIEGISLPDFDEIDINSLMNPSEKEKPEVGSLRESFGVVPFSVLDTRKGEWLERKREWQKLGFNSQETREDVELIAQSGQSTQIYNLRNEMREALNRDPSWDEIIKTAKKRGLHVFEGASIFDPVLTEMMYRWFCPENGLILDPFAGGSVRGIVAGILDFDYYGIDLRKDQVEANEKQWNEIDIENISNVFWEAGDSNKVLDEDNPKQVDFVFSCPPYHDLEQYSDDPKDLSNMNYEEFLNIYRSIINKSVKKLKDDSFACFVVGDIRDKNGMYRNFVSHTIQAFEDAGMELYNEMILINSIGSMAIRLRRQFNTGRKVGKIHQNVLVFFKGDPKKIKDKYKELNLGESLINEDIQRNITV